MSGDAPVSEGQILTGPLFSESMRVETIRTNGPDTWVVGLVGLQSEQFRRVTLTRHDLSSLTIADSALSYDGDGHHLRLGLQAHSPGIAYEFDPYFGLSISRVDPLPHQLEAVYDHLIKLPRVRFLLADDAGAGKTIMAGLLIPELKLRGLANRTLVVCPSNLTFQWQRELKEKFLALDVAVMAGDNTRCSRFAASLLDGCRCPAAVRLMAMLADAAGVCGGLNGRRSTGLYGRESPDRPVRSWTH